MRVAKSLSVRGVEHYLPLYRERVKWTDRSVITDRPLFPGYVFTRYSPESRIVVISTPGVVRSLGDDDRCLVSHAELERIREGLDTGCSLRPQSSVPIGTFVRIRSGVFEGVEGVVTDLRQQCKVVIALAAVSQCFSLEVELRDIEILNKPVAGLKPIPKGESNGWNLQTVRS